MDNRTLRSLGLSDEAIADISNTQFQRLKATRLTGLAPLKAHNE